MCESDSYTYSVKSSFPWDNVGGWCWPFLQRNRWSVLLRQRAFMSWLDCDSLKEVDRQISLMSDIKLNDIKIHEFFSRFYEWILFVIGFGGLVSKGHLPLWQAWATQTAHMQGIVQNLMCPESSSNFWSKPGNNKVNFCFGGGGHTLSPSKMVHDSLIPWCPGFFLKSKSQTWLPERTKRMTMAVPFFGRGSQFWCDRASQIEPHLTIHDLWRYRAQSCTDCRYELRYDLSPLMLKAATQHSNLFVWGDDHWRDEMHSWGSVKMRMPCIPRHDGTRDRRPETRFLFADYCLTIYDNIQQLHITEIAFCCKSSWFSLWLWFHSIIAQRLKVPLVLFQPCRSFLQAGLAGPRLFQHTLAGLEK